MFTHSRPKFGLVTGCLIACVLMSPAQATSIETNGGLKVKSDDGEFEFNVGGRIHFDLDVIQDDTSASFGSGVMPSNSSPLFRRARLSFTGRFHEWEYNFTPDFAQSFGGNLRINTCIETPCSLPSQGVAFQELYVARAIGPGKLYVGQFIPFRSIEDQTSSNDLTMMERAFTSALGVYRGGVLRLFVMGAGYLAKPTPQTTLGAAVYSLRKDDTPATEGWGMTMRGTWAPQMRDRHIVHLGLSGGLENPHNGSTSSNIGTLVSYAGIRGPTANLGATTGSERAHYAAVEFASVQGPFFVQSELVQARYGQSESSPVDQTATRVYHLTLSYHLFGESKPYDPKKAAFKNVLPRNRLGAIELTARREFGENLDPLTASAVKQVHADTVGVNYYLSPNMRLMANYIFSEAERVDGEKDRPRTLTLRLQANW